MRKLVVGLIVAVVVGAGAYFGAVYWAERTAAREVDAMLDRWRAGGGTATRGRVAFDLWTRTVRVADVALQSASSPDERIAIDEVVAVGIEPSGRVRRLDIVGLDMGYALVGLGGAKVQQKAPRVTLTDFSERPTLRTKGASPVDAMRRWLEQLSAISASSIEAPTLTVTVTPATNSRRPEQTGAAEYTYSNVVLRDVAKGRVAEATVDSVAFQGSAGGMPQGVSQGFTGELANVSVRDIDMGPVLAWLDPSRPRAEDYQRVYGQLAAGPYTVRFGDGASMGVDKVVSEDIGLRPARLDLDDLVFLMEVTRPGPAQATPGQLGMLIDKMAGMYEGFHVGKVEMQGLRVDTPRESIKIAGIGLDALDSGRMAGISIQGFEGRTPAKEPLGIGRITVKGFHIANLLRTTSTQLASLGVQAGGSNPLLAMLGLVEGIELRDVTVTDPKSGRVIRLEALDASWGQLVGGIPSEARLSARLSGPASATASESLVRALAARGIGSLAANLDLGARWEEAAQRVMLAPATMEIHDLLVLSFKASAGNVPREMLSSDVVKVMGGAPLVEAGPVELTLRDRGVVELAAAQMGLTKGGDAEAGRAMLAELVAQWAAKATPTAPELQPIFDALTRFVQGKGETLTVALTPKGSVGLLQVVEAARRDAMGALLANFTVEARTGG